MPRRRLSAGLAAVVAVVLPLAAGSVAAADPVTQKQGGRTVAVSESANLPATDATLTVTGTGFDSKVDAYVAVCRADIAPSDPLTDCLGGAVPEQNESADWAVVTSDPNGKRRAVTFGTGGSFSVDLAIGSASDSGVDCVGGGCVLIVRSAGDQAGRPKDITIELGFANPGPSTSTLTSTSASTSTSTPTSDAPATVGPDTVALPDAYLGQQQTVVFSGFTPGEDVAVTVFSEPVGIEGIVATAGGVVAITFPIAEAQAPGVHTVQAIGAQSGLIGLATFTVVAAPVTSASVESSASAPSSENTAQSSPSAAPVTEAGPATTALATTSFAAAPATSTGSGTSLWWLWLLLALLVVAVAVAVAVVSARRRAQLLEQQEWDREQELAAAASAPAGWPAATAPRAAVADPQSPPDSPYDDGRSYDGLLSGRQGDGPDLYSGQGVAAEPEPPTRWDGPDEAGDLPTSVIPAVGADGPVEPTTRRLNPSGTSVDPDGSLPDPDGTLPDPDGSAPRTQQWSPFPPDDVDGEDLPPRR